MIFRNSTGNILMVVFSCGLFSLGLTQGPQSLAQQREDVLKVKTEVVNVVAVVRDRKEKLIADLGRTDFEILEDGVPQEVRYFSRETDISLTLGLLMDTSGSVQNVLDFEKEQAKAFFRRVMRPKDMAFVISFDIDVLLLKDFTGEVEELARAIDSAVINTGGALQPLGRMPGGRRRGGFPFPGPFPGPSPAPTPGPIPSGPPRGTLLYDAVFLAATEQMANEVGRKVLILLSDGEDQGSQTELAQAIESVHKADTVTYSLPVTDTRFYSRLYSGYRGGRVLKKISRETGGRVVRVGRVDKIAKAFNEIAEELRSQYSLGYTPSRETKKSGFRKIQVRVRGKNYKVQARRGYYPAD